MKRMMIVALLMASPAWADEASLTLKPGPGADVTAANCATCHSLDYIQMNGGFISETTWKAEVAKMRGPFGAPIEAALSDEILAYLVTNYGAPAR